MEMYRSGRNEADSKSVDGSNRPGVRIPPSPPEPAAVIPLQVFSLCQLLLFLRAVEHPVHGICRSLLRRVVKVCVDICRGGEGAVPEPDLDLLHGDTVAEKQAGAGVAKIMEANFAKSILLDEPGEMFRHIVWSQKFSALVNADVTSSAFAMYR